MPVFTNFSDTLPDPNNRIETSGAAGAPPIPGPATGSAGPGFASVKFRSSRQVQMSRTISGRGVTASPGYHTWEFDINYNPLTRAEFEPVSTFLESREGRLRPFFVILPQHAAPQNSTFATYCASNTIRAGWKFATTSAAGASGTVTIGFAVQNQIPFKVGDSIVVAGVTPASYNGTFTVTAATTSTVRYAHTATGSQTVAGTVTLAAQPAGSSTLLISGLSTVSGSPSPGDFITISDNSDDNHKKAYKVVRVEDINNYQTGTVIPTAAQRRIHIMPPLSRATYSDATINFLNPKFRVIQKGDTLEYDLNTDNLYQFSLSLEEMLP